MGERHRVTVEVKMEASRVSDAVEAVQKGLTDLQRSVRKSGQSAQERPNVSILSAERIRSKSEVVERTVEVTEERQEGGEQ